jgi:hypothetical protein
MQFFPLGLSTSASGGVLDTAASRGRRLSYNLDVEGNWLSLSTNGATPVTRTSDAQNKSTTYGSGSYVTHHPPAAIAAGSPGSLPVVT